MKLSWVILLSCLLAPLSVFAAEPVTLTVAQPETGALLKTMAELRELRQQGLTDPVVIQIPSGTYRLTEPLQLTAADVESGLKFLATGDEPVLISGARLLNAAGRTEQGLVRYAVPEGIGWEVLPRLLLVEGQIQTPGRYPDQGYLRIEKALPDRRSGFTIPADSPEAQIRPAAGYDLIFLHDWSSSRIPVKQYDSSTRTLTTTGPIGCEASHYAIDHFEAHPRYYLEGHPAFVNLPGEWYADQETREILVKPFSDEADPIVELPLLTTLIEATGQEDKPLSGLIFQGIVFSGTGFPMPPGGYAAAQASMHEPRDASGARLTKNRPMLDAAVTISIARHCRFLNCQFVQLGGTGLWIGSRSRECVVQRCKFSRIGGNGLNIGEDNSRHVNGKVWFSAAPEQIPTGNRIEQCEIADCGVVLPGAVGIWAPLHRELQIVQNHLHDCPYTGISLGWMWNDSVTPAGGNVISGNHIEYVMQVLSDGGGIYTLGRQPDSIIENNRIHDIPLNAGRAESNGMFLYEGSTGFVIRGNEIRRITKSPLRFHRAGQNTARGNRWELRDAETPPIRFNNTPAENITSLENEVVSPQKRIYLIGNSLTWDTIPSLLDEVAEWHVDCGKPLPYIHAHPEAPCVGTSRIWPRAFQTAQYDLISFQPHYGSTLEEDFTTISDWLKRQPHARVVIHSGWARSADFEAEWTSTATTGPMVHSPDWLTALLQKLREAWPEREFTTTYATHALALITEDIKAGTAPFQSLEEIYRDAIHMQLGTGRYLMHNLMRQTLGQPPTDTNWKDLDPKLKQYLDGILNEIAAQRSEH